MNSNKKPQDPRINRAVEALNNMIERHNRQAEEDFPAHEGENGVMECGCSDCSSAAFAICVLTGQEDW